MSFQPDSFASTESNELIELALILRELILLAQNAEWDKLTERTPHLLIALQKAEQFNFIQLGKTNDVAATQVVELVDLILRGMKALSELLEPRKEDLKSLLQNSFNAKQLLQKYGP